VPLSKDAVLVLPVVVSVGLCWPFAIGTGVWILCAHLGISGNVRATGSCNIHLKPGEFWHSNRWPYRKRMRLGKNDWCLRSGLMLRLR